MDMLADVDDRNGLMEGWTDGMRELDEVFLLPGQD